MSRRRAGRLLLLPGVLAAAAALTLVGAGRAATPGPSPGPAVGSPTAVLPPESPVPGQASEQRSPAANQPEQQKQPPSGQPSAPGLLARGKELYGAGCAGCHGQQGEGSPRGPAVAGVGPADVDFYVSSGRMPLREPVAQPERRPPVYDQADIDAIVAYVASLGPGGEPIPQLPAGDLRVGRELYLQNCASCHASTGVGAALPAGRVAPGLLHVPPVQVAEAVRVGPGLMPEFPRSALNDEQLADIVTYVTDLSRHADHGGTPLGAVGPVTEGFVGWVLGLGALVVVIRLLGQKAPR